jgi:hypothetical protein
MLGSQERNDAGSNDLGGMGHNNQGLLESHGVNKKGDKVKDVGDTGNNENDELEPDNKNKAKEVNSARVESPGSNNVGKDVERGKETYEHESNT